MRTIFTSALAASAAVLLSSCATRMATDPTAPAGPPDATLSMESVQAAYYGSASTGQGTINYRGQTRKFTISGAGAGGAGAQHISATGKVYHLKSLADFPGTYTGARSGLTLGSGQMTERLENAKGTVIYLTGRTSGLSTSVGLDKMIITLE